MNVDRKGIVIEPTTNLGKGSGKFSIGMSLNRSLGLPTMNTRVAETSQMVYTNPIMITHVYKTTYQPSMNSLVVRGYRIIDVEDPKRGHQNHLS
jgi:hypothetical protein